MRIVFSSYEQSERFTDPQAWFERTVAYGGILQALARQHEVISIEQIDYVGQVMYNGIDYRFKRYRMNALRFFPWALHRYIKNLKPDVVIVHGLHFPLQVMQLRLILGPRVKIIVQNHAEKPFTNWKKILQQLVDLHINAYLFASREMGLEWISSGNLASPHKIHEVMEVSSVFNPLDKTEARACTGISGGQVFLWVGRLNTNKDPLTVLSAFLKYVKINPKARLYMIYGTDELLPEIKTLLTTSPYTNAVTLIGKIAHVELLYWFNSADFILSGSHYEGSGTAICEAMSCGCVPVVTDILSFRMITNNGTCGVLYEAGNEAALLNALIKTQTMDIAAMRKASINYFNDHLSFNSIATQIAHIASSL